MNNRQLHYLRSMNIDVWQRRDPASAEDVSQSRPDESVAQLQVAAKVVAESSSGVSGTVAVSVAAPALESWSDIETAVRKCTLCSLHATRTQTVFGVGDRMARWMIIGEAPGADEDRQGEPFVGRAGQLLNSMLLAIGLQREQVFIANILKCRPPNNRDPKPEEVSCCMPYLQRQIDLVNPGIILCVGRIAAQNLLATDTPIGKLRGSVHYLGTRRRPVVVTYHPAYLLRSPGEKRKTWHDLQFALTAVAAIDASAS